ncbi:hypothetical protein R1flu_008616 [Riccia fluitans]|uniref:Uncharacterized protein n=1 Tax=Riccia fluitans TaxID=41844 RepID=A0ABD1YC75_9MARC
MVDKDGILVTIEAILNEEGGLFNAEAEADRRGTKRRQDSPKTPVDKPKLRRKTKVTKKPHETIYLSDESQEVKQEEKTILPKDSL